MTRTKYQLEKREKELARKRRKTEKRLRKRARNNLALKGNPAHLLQEERE